MQSAVSDDTAGRSPKSSSYETVAGLVPTARTVPLPIIIFGNPDRAAICRKRDFAVTAGATSTRKEEAELSPRSHRHCGIRCCQFLPTFLPHAPARR